MRVPVRTKVYCVPVRRRLPLRRLLGAADDQIAVLVSGAVEPRVGSEVPQSRPAGAQTQIDTGRRHRVVRLQV